MKELTAADLAALKCFKIRKFLKILVSLNDKEHDEFEALVKEMVKIKENYDVRNEQQMQQHLQSAVSAKHLPEHKFNLYLGYLDKCLVYD